MSRPKKQGMEYFTIDVNFYQDIKIRKLIRYKGVQAVSVYHILLCQIYASGYYLLWDEDIPFTVSEIAHLEEVYVQEVIDYCFNIGLFDKALYEQNNVLTSRGIQKRFFDFCAVAKRRLPAYLPYRMLDDKEISVISEESEIIPEKNQVISEITDDNTEETPINSGISTQSKVKESKVKHSSSADIRAREGELALVECDDTVVCDGVDAEVAELRQSPIWKEQIFMRFKFLNVNVQMLDDYLDRWSQEVKASGKLHQNLGDAKHHFVSWMIIQEDKFNKQQHEHGTDNNNGYRSSEDIYAGAARIMQELRAEGAAPKRKLPVV